MRQIKVKAQSKKKAKAKSAVVLGIDPGYGRVGYGVIEESGGNMRALAFGCMETERGEAPAVRLLQIARGLRELFSKFGPELVALERLFFSKNIKTALGVGEARGVIIFTAAERDLPIFEVTPQEVKQAVTGYGNAEKKQIQKMVQRILGLSAPPRPDDAADALAIAIAALQSRNFLSKL